MEVMHFKDARKFQSRVLEYLAKNEAENNLILGILANLIGDDYSGNPPYLAVIEDAGAIQAVSLCTPPWPALISYRTPPPAKDVLKVILDDMQATLQDDFIGFSANKEFASRLIAQWVENTGKEAILEMSMRIYKLEAVQAVSGVPGEMRLVKEEERDLVEDWFVGFHREALREEPDLTRIKKMVNAYLSSETHLRGLMIWKTIGQPVSMAGYAGPTPNGIRIGAVYTPPEMRKQGYASAVTAGLSQYLLDQGYRFCFLFTDLLNPTSNHIYQQIGYQPVCDVDRYMFG